MFGWGKKTRNVSGSGTPAVDLEQLVAASGDAFVVCDVQGAIILWNPAAERLFGYSRAEALGASLDLIIPERLRQRHWDGHHASMKSGTTRYGNDLLKVPAVTKDGRSLSIAFTIAMLRGPDGAVNGVASIIRDETARFQQDRALRKRISDLEAASATGQPARQA